MNANGRVNILEDPPQNVFNLYDRIPINEKITSYNDALTGNFEQSNLSRAFFSAKNIIIIQNALMAGVNKASNCQSINLLPCSLTKHLGLSAVFSFILLPLPAARIIALIKILQKYVLNGECHSC